MRIITGKLKGRKIPFINKKFDNADVTTDKVKEALFSALGSQLSGDRFLDLFGGSGQIGFEAYSRGADVVINELNKQRFAFIRECAEHFGVLEDITLYNFKDTQCLRYLSKKAQPFDILFCDPPYQKDRKANNHISLLMREVALQGLLVKGGLFVCQFYTKNEIKNIPECFNHQTTKKYGNTSLAFFSYDEITQ